MTRDEVVSIVERLSSLSLIRPYRIYGNYYQCYCPIHSDGNERRPSFGILLEDEYRNGSYYAAGWCHCFTCGISISIVEMITRVLSSKNISMSGSQWMASEGFQEDVYDEDPLIPEDVSKVFQMNMNQDSALNYIKKISYQSTQGYISEEELASYRYTVPYMYERGLTDDLIEKYDIGVDLNFIPPGSKKSVPTITFPVRDSSGRTMFVARRSIKGKAFYLPQGVEKSLYGLYELPKQCKCLTIVESVFNLTSAVKYGSPTVALLGTGNSYQIKELRKLGVKEFRLGLDPDDAGKRGTQRLKKGLRDIALIWEYSGIPEGKDINDLTFEEFKNLELV